MFLCLCVLNNLFRSFHYYLWAVSAYKDSDFFLDYQVFPRLICAKLRKVMQSRTALCNVVQNGFLRVVSLHCLSGRIAILVHKECILTGGRIAILFV